MINEKQLIEILQKNSIFEKITNAEGKNIYEIIDDLPKVDEWIPCIERLPIGEEYKKKIEDEWFYKKVLTTEEGEMHIGWYDQEDECWYDCQGFMMHPVAWQFLPQPHNANMRKKVE